MKATASQSILTPFAMSGNLFLYVLRIEDRFSMPTTVEEVLEFQLFAVEQLRNGDSDPSLEELVARCRAQRSETKAPLRIKVNAAIRRGIAEADAGMGRPLDEFMNEFRQRHKIASDA